MIVLNALVGKVGWNKINKSTEYKKGFYSWTPRAVVVLNEQTMGVKLISALNYKEFSKKGEKYLREYMRPEWFKDQKKTCLARV